MIAVRRLGLHWLLALAALASTMAPWLPHDHRVGEPHGVTLAALTTASDVDAPADSESAADLCAACLLCAAIALPATFSVPVLAALARALDARFSRTAPRPAPAWLLPASRAPPVATR